MYFSKDGKMNVKQFIERAEKKNPKADAKILRQAFIYSQKAHKKQKRISGDDYFVHPLAVSLIVMDMKLDSETVAAALLHDVVEDTPTIIEDLSKDFSQSICVLVDGVTKLGEVDFDKYSKGEVTEKNLDKGVESMRKLFLATAKDTRVVFIKLADRLHNMRTLSFLPEDARKRIAQETLDIFAPLADRLSMGQLKAELEDLSFFHLHPKEYREVKKKVAKKIQEGKRSLPKIKKFMNKVLDQDGITSQIDGRVKHVYSVYKKLMKYDGDIDKIYDVMAVRVVVDSVDDCYKTLGIVHANFKPLIYRIKDYIALPKTNGYRSLHTTVFGMDGKITEIQIRTQEMHEEAENGVAAHWKYAESKEKVYAGGINSLATSQEIKVVEELKRFSGVDAGSFKDQTLEIFSSRIFVFSPTGDIFELPEGATTIDFAYAVHSRVAEKCIGAKVNGRIVPLDTKLENRDIVDIVTSNSSSGPSRDWLYYAFTPRAKQKIRNFLRKKNRVQNIEIGRETLDEELKVLAKPKVESISKEVWKKILETLPQKDKEDVLAGIGDGSISVKQIARLLFPQEKKIKVLETGKLPLRDSGEAITEMIAGGKGLKLNIASCCKPSVNNKIIGYITVGKGLTVHKIQCKNIMNCDERRLVEVRWESEDTRARAIHLSLIFIDRKGLLKEITTMISDMNMNIAGLETKPAREGRVKVLLGVEIGSGFQMRMLEKKISQVKGLKEMHYY